MMTSLTMAVMEGIAFRSKDSVRTAITTLGKVSLDWEPLKDTSKGKTVLTHLHLAEEALKLLRFEIHGFAIDLEFGKYPKEREA